MRWSSIKNIIILLLVIVNLFLVGLVGLRAWRSRRNEQETRTRMVAVLEQNRIAYLPGEVPGALEPEGRRVILSPLGEAEAAALVGTVADMHTAGARVTYEGALGVMTCAATGEVQVHLEPGARPLAGADPGTAGAEALAVLGVEVRERERLTQDETVRVTFTQLWEGVPVPEWEAEVLFREGSMESLSVRRLAGEWEAVAAASEAIDAPTALVRFLEALNEGGYVCSQVTDLYAGYAVSGTGTVTLTPTWYVETDTSPWRFAVDGYTGAVTAGG